MKQQLKRVIRFCGKKISIRTRLSPDRARSFLQNYSPKPLGKCKTNNDLALSYDLQIIVPCYNVERYIKQCLDSVFMQQTDYSVIISIVNDGSTDGTVDVLKRLLGKVNTEGCPFHFDDMIDIEVITQDNKGLSGARNAALGVIKGTYVTFLDSDDVIVDGAIQKMLDAAYKYDAEILQGSWYTFSEGETQVHIISKNGMIDDNRKIISGYPWGKLYKYNVLEHFQFPNGFWFEDTPLSFIIAAMDYRCDAVYDVVYGYRLNPKGITATSRKNKRSVESYWITESCLEQFPDFNLSYDQRAYEYLLRQSLQNEGRVRHQSYNVRRAEFILTAELMDKYFEGFRTNDVEMKWVESAIRNRQFVKFDLGTLL